jgi:general secretion pathway protein A
MLLFSQEVRKNMEAWASSLIVGTLIAVSLTWLVSLFNARYFKRETGKIDSASGRKEGEAFAYNNFYAFSRDPFDPQPDPRLIFLTENVREVWNSILSGITQRKRFLLLTGERGIGKTTLISLIYLYLATNGGQVKVVPPADSPRKIEEVLPPLLRCLELSPMENSKGQMLFQLQGALAKGTAREETVALIIDGAQDLTRGTLEDIRFLANPTPKIPNPLQEIFVGDSKFEENLSSPDLASLNQRIEVRCRLLPFTPEESLGYIEHRLSRAGTTTSKVFTPRAVFLIAQTGGGNPGSLNRICQEALWMGYSKLKKPIDPANVREALGNLRMQKEYGWPLSPKILPWIKKAWEIPKIPLHYTHR